ncbi:glycosyltransferase family 2 protein [Streptomyces sp. NPDC050619]|uniref:glycosyltransferase family 2 protein n=1 Tax=Streptomyces sp. NPDC050619 TaxID=3157214 RepID=UPI00341863A2
MAGPAVSVIVAAYNAMPYLTRCITSVAEQSIGRDALDVIVVDDGSTDGTARELDRLAALHPGLLRVIRQENSGGPAAPRNVGLDHARGTFVFFLDADDYLGPEALERMVAMAEANGTDVVLGKMVGVGGRTPPASMFRRDQPRTDVFSSRVYWTLNPMKLFRRDLLERHRLRFPTDLPTGEDQPFVASAYLHASGISVLAGYDCLFWVLRDDEGNITRSTSGSEPRLRFLARMVDLITANVPAGPGRDHLAHRHLAVEVRTLLRVHLVLEPRETQRRTLDRLAEIIEPLLHDGLRDRLPALVWLRLHLIRHRMLDELLDVIRFEEDPRAGAASAPVVVEGGRAYARYPYFRDPERALPDTCYDITAELGPRHHVSRAELLGTTLHLTGHGYLHRVETRDVATELVVRERDRGTEYRLPVTHTATPGLGEDGSEKGVGHSYDKAGFEAVVDLTTAADGKPLGDGLWDLCLAIGAQGLTREVRIGSKRAADVSGQAATHLVDTAEGTRAVTLYTTKPHGNFTLDLGERKHRVLSRLGIDAVGWAPDAPNELEFTGRCTLAAYPEGTLTLSLSPDDGRLGATAEFPARHSGKGFVIRVPVTELPAGVWTGELRLADWFWPLPELPEGFSSVKWRNRGGRWQAGPAARRGEGFALQVARAGLIRALTRRFKR